MIATILIIILIYCLKKGIENTEARYEKELISVEFKIDQFIKAKRDIGHIKIKALSENKMVRIFEIIVDKYTNKIKFTLDKENKTLKLEKRNIDRTSKINFIDKRTKKIRYYQMSEKYGLYIEKNTKYEVKYDNKKRYLVASMEKQIKDKIEKEIKGRK